MASSFESLEKVPVWQRLLLWLLMAAAIAAGWYYLFYVDAVSSREAAEVGLEKAKTELADLEQRKKNFLEEQRKHEARKAELLAEREKLSTSSTTVDNMMQTFQQKARQVGLSFDSWTNESEQRQDVYARLPVKVAAAGSWAQVGEFFRQVNELEQTISIENLKLENTAKDKKREEGASDHPDLEIEFEAATYRALTDEERNAPATGRERPSRRKGG